MSEEATLDEFANESGEDSGLQNTPTGTYSLAWDITRGGEHFSLRNGEFLTSDERDEDGNYPVYGGNGIMGYGPESNVREGTIVIGRVGAYCGNVHQTRSDAWITDNSIILNDVAEIYSKAYLKYLLTSVGLGQFSEQSAQPRISQSTVENLRIPHPPLEEQRKIATVLHTVDQAIQKTGEIIEQAETVQNGLMQKLFRTGTGDPKIKDLRRIGQVPEHWEVVKLGEICDRITDGTHKSPPTTEEGYPYITSQNIRNWGFELNDLKYIAEEDHDRITSRCNPEFGDVLYVKDGANTGNVNVNTLDFEFSLLSSVALIKPNENLVKSWFLKHLLSWPKFRELVLSQMSGTGIRRLTISKLEKTDVLLPPLEEQERIIDILDEYYSYRENQREYKTQLQRLKQGLMQDLLSGAVRTHEAAIEVSEAVLAQG